MPLHGVAELVRENRVFFECTPPTLMTFTPEEYEEMDMDTEVLVPWHFDVITKGLLGRETGVSGIPGGSFKPLSALTDDIRAFSKTDDYIKKYPGGFVLK